MKGRSSRPVSFKVVLPAAAALLLLLRPPAVLPERGVPPDAGNPALISAHSDDDGLAKKKDTSTPTTTVAPTDTPTSTSTPPFSPTPTFTPTDTATPTSTAAHTSTATPTPTQTPTATAPPVFLPLALKGLAVATPTMTPTPTATPTTASPGKALDGLPVQCVYVDDGGIYAGTGGGLGVYRSEDGGDTWDGHGDGLGVNDVLAIVPRGDDLLAGTWDDGGVYRRSASDTSWSPFSQDMTSGYMWIRAMAVDSGSTPVAYAADPDRVVYRLAWGSSAWEEISPAGLPTPAPGDDDTKYDVRCLFVSDGTLHVGLAEAGVYEYSGSDWQPKGDLGARSALAMDHGPDGVLWVGTSDGVFRWSGAWTPVSNTSGWQVTALRRNPQHTDELYAGLATGEVHGYSQNTGSWETVNVGIPAGEWVWSIDFGTGEPQRLFVGASGGLYYIDLPQATSASR